jgi:hypothetical protein
MLMMVRDEEWRYLARPVREIGAVRLLDHRQPADARADADAAAILVARVIVEARIADASIVATSP